MKGQREIQLLPAPHHPTRSQTQHQHQHRPCASRNPRPFQIREQRISRAGVGHPKRFQSAPSGRADPLRVPLMEAPPHHTPVTSVHCTYRLSRPTAGFLRGFGTWGTSDKGAAGSSGHSGRARRLLVLRARGRTGVPPRPCTLHSHPQCTGAPVTLGHTHSPPHPAPTPRPPLRTHLRVPPPVGPAPAPAGGSGPALGAPRRAGGSGHGWFSRRGTKAAPASPLRARAAAAAGGPGRLRRPLAPRCPLRGRSGSGSGARCCPPPPPPPPPGSAPHRTAPHSAHQLFIARLWLPGRSQSQAAAPLMGPPRARAQATALGGRGRPGARGAGGARAKLPTARAADHPPTRRGCGRGCGRGRGGGGAAWGESLGAVSGEPRSRARPCALPALTGWRARPGSGH